MRKFLFLFCGATALSLGLAARAAPVEYILTGYVQDASVSQPFSGISFNQPPPLVYSGFFTMDLFGDTSNIINSGGGFFSNAGFSSETFQINNSGTPPLSVTLTDSITLFVNQSANALGMWDLPDTSNSGDLVDLDGPPPGPTSLSNFELATDYGAVGTQFDGPTASNQAFWLDSSGGTISFATGSMDTSVLFQAIVSPSQSAVPDAAATLGLLVLALAAMASQRERLESRISMQRI